MAPKNKARQKPGNMRSRQQAKLNSQKAQKAPIEPSNRVGPRRQLPPSSEGGRRVGNSSQPWGEQQGSGNEVRQVRVREVRPQLPAGKTVPENRRLPGMQGPQPAPRPQQPGTSRPSLDRRTAAEAKAAEAAKGTRSTSIKIGDAAKRGKMGGAAEGALFAAGSAAIDWYGKALRNAIQQERSQRAAESGQRGRYAPGNQQVKFDKPESPKKPVDKKPGGVKPAAEQPTTFTRPAARVSSPAPKPATKSSSTQTGNKEADMSTWAKANRKMIEKVGTKSQREILAKALGGSNTANDQLKVKPTEAKTDSSTAANSSMDKNKTSIEGDKKAQAFTQKMTAEERRKRERMAQARLNGNA